MLFLAKKWAVTVLAAWLAVFPFIAQPTYAQDYLPGFVPIPAFVHTEFQEQALAASAIRFLRHPFNPQLTLSESHKESTLALESFQTDLPEFHESFLFTLGLGVLLHFFSTTVSQITPITTLNMEFFGLPSWSVWHAVGYTAAAAIFTLSTFFKDVKAPDEGLPLTPAAYFLLGFGMHWDQIPFNEIRRSGWEKILFQIDSANLEAFQTLYADMDLQVGRPWQLIFKDGDPVAVVIEPGWAFRSIQYKAPRVMSLVPLNITRDAPWLDILELTPGTVVPVMQSFQLVEVHDLATPLVLFQGVYNPTLSSDNSQPSSGALLETFPNVRQKKVLVGGAGLGVLNFKALEQGAAFVLAYDSNPIAWAGLLYNARRLGYSRRRLVIYHTDRLLNLPTLWNHRFDRVLGNPPQRRRVNAEMLIQHSPQALRRNVFDPGASLLDDLLLNSATFLKEDDPGVSLELAFSELEHAYIAEIALGGNLQITEVYKHPRPVHEGYVHYTLERRSPAETQPKSSTPLHVARVIHVDPLQIINVAHTIDVQLEQWKLKRGTARSIGSALIVDSNETASFLQTIVQLALPEADIHWRPFNWRKEYIDHLPFELVLTHWRMQSSNAAQFLSQLRQSSKSAFVVIFGSSLDHLEVTKLEADLLLRDRDVFFLPKPFNPSELRKLIKALTDASPIKPGTLMGAILAPLVIGLTFIAMSAQERIFAYSLSLAIGILAFSLIKWNEDRAQNQGFRQLRELSA